MRVRQVLGICLVLAVKLPLNVLLTVISNIARIIAPNVVFRYTKKIMDSEIMKRGVEKPEDATFLFSMDRVKMQTKMQIRDVMKTAELGHLAPDAELVDLETRKRVSLLSLARAGRPLILNFGSIS